MSISKAVFLSILLMPFLAFADEKPVTATDTEVTSPVAVKVVETKVDTKVTEVVPESPEQAIDAAKSVFSGFKSGKYREAVAGIILLLVFVWRRFLGAFILNKLSGWWIGFVTVLLGFVGSIPEALMMDPFKWSTFIWSGLITSAEAMLMWQMVFKRLPWFQMKQEAKPEVIEIDEVEDTEKVEKKEEK